MPDVNITVDGKKVTVTGEVAQQIGEGRCRAVCLKPTDGLRRGTEVRNTGHGIQVPVGDRTLGHVWNVIGEPLDATALRVVDERGRDVEPGGRGQVVISNLTNFATGAQVWNGSYEVRTLN